MEPIIILTIPGEPKGKGRPRARIVHTRGGSQFVAMYTPAKTRSYEGELAFFAQMAMKGRDLFDGPLAVDIEARFSVPHSWSNKKRINALAGVLRPTGKPDLDNIMKMVDGLNKIVWRDDSQIVDARIRKLYTDKPALVIKIARAEVLLLRSEAA